MPTRPCPNCPSTGLRFLPTASTGGLVNYYRCDACGYVFTVPKAEPDAEPIPITTEL